MIRVSLDDAIALLHDWKDRGVWLGSNLFLGEDGKEEHRFLARVSDASPEKLTLDGLNSFVEVSLEEDAVVEYGETSEVPLPLRERFSEYEFCLTIRSNKVVAFLFGQRPKNDWLDIGANPP